MDKIVENLQEEHSQSRNSSEETNKNLNLVFEEQHHSKRDRDCLDQDINKLFNVYHSMKPQPQGHAMDNPYHQDEIKPDAMFMNKARSPSQYQDGDNMPYSEKESLKQLPEASSWLKFSGTGEYDDMELLDYIDRLFIDVPRIPDYWITFRLNTEFKGHASIWYTKMKEIHSGRVKSSKSKAMMRNHELLTQIPGELENAVKCRCNHNCTLYDIKNVLQDGGVYRQTQRKGGRSGKEEKFLSQLWFNRQLCQQLSKGKEKVYAIEKVPDEESPTEDSESYSMGDAIREQSYDDQDPREEFLVEYQEETPLEIQDIQLEAGLPQDTANKNLGKHTQDAQKFPVTPTKGMAYIHGTATKMTVCIENAQHLLIIDSGAHCSIVARNYLDNQFPNWENQLLPTKERNFKSESGKMTSIGKITKEITIPHRKGKIRLNPEFVVLDDAHIQEFFLGTDYQRIYAIDIYISKNRHITIGTNMEKKFSLDIYQISAQDPLEELLNEFREGQFSTALTSKQKLSLMKILRKNRPAFAIGEEQLGKIRGHDIELYLDVERPYPPMLRRPPYPASLETRKEIEKHINKILEMDVIRKIGHNEIVEITTSVLITLHDGKSRLC
ncbi:hypothetical protein O181_063832 [Austropuccinia psidii MF-1]|uniref:Uncharacterized protein n=1 Tax=Austropuccinia psidii MF-1 TaxID=1389203 RepID=A0A9Q3EUM2_9BASI|nr:hypothetical protein [Austropuccinia psidii MF-1]